VFFVNYAGIVVRFERRSTRSEAESVFIRKQVRAGAQTKLFDEKVLVAGESHLFHQSSKLFREEFKQLKWVRRLQIIEKYSLVCYYDTASKNKRLLVLL